MDRVNLAEFAAAREGGGELEIVDVASLGAGLENPPVAIGRVGELLAFADRHAARLLAVNVFAGFGGEHAGDRVPPVAGRDQHGVDIGATVDFRHFAGLHAVLVVVLAVGHHADDFAPRFLHIGDHDELHVGLAEKRFEDLAPARADADAPEHDAVAGCDRAVFAQDGGGNDRGHAQRDRGGFEKLSAGEFHGEGAGRGEEDGEFFRDRKRCSGRAMERGGTGGEGISRRSHPQGEFGRRLGVAGGRFTDAGRIRTQKTRGRAMRAPREDQSR